MSIGPISSVLYPAGIITHDVFQSPSYNTIIDQFEVGMNIKRTQRDLEEHCKKFIAALTKHGNLQVKNIAEKIRQEWAEHFPSGEFLIVTEMIF